MTEQSLERETKTVEIPGGHQIVLKTYITGREKREITAPYLQNMEVTQKISKGKDNEMSIAGFKAEQTAQAEEKALTLVVVSLDNRPDDIVNRILDLPIESYEAVVAEVNEVTGGKKKETT